MPTFPNQARFPDVRAIRSTDSALLVAVDGREIWFPNSHVDDESEVWQEGDEGELVVSEWIATQKDLV
jgi:hypothetical protein